MNPSRPLVSVIVPAYNAAAHLRQTLGFVQAQTCRSLEVIVVDDGSKDDTSAIAQAAQAEDPRVRVIRQPNRGVGAARNAGIRAARGKYIAPLDADDLWSNRKLERQISRIEHAGTNAGLVYCWSRNIDQQSRVISWAYPYRIEGRVGSAMMLGNFVGSASVPLFRSAALAQVGVYLTREEQDGAQGCEDWDLNIRVAEKFRVCCVREYLVSYRQSDASMSLNWASMTKSYEAAMRRASTRLPHLSPALYAWSAGRFYSYLVGKCYGWSDYPAALFYLGKVLRADPAALLNARNYRIGFLALTHLITGGTLRRHRIPPAITRSGDPFFKEAAPEVLPNRSLFEQIQNRRFSIALKTSASKPKMHVKVSDAFGY